LNQKKHFGLTFTYNNSELKLEHTKLKLTKAYQNYPYLLDNHLSLVSFLEDYKEFSDSKCYEENGQIILETNQKNGNKYTYSKKLYINKENAKPVKLEVRDITQKVVINILYNEVKINDLQKET
jgi:hypothetical protein